MKNVIKGLLKVLVLFFGFFGGIVGSKNSSPVLIEDWVMIYVATLLAGIVFILSIWIAKGRVVWKKPSIFNSLLRLDEPVHLVLFLTAYLGFGAAGYVAGWFLLGDDIFIFPYVNSLAVASIGFMSGIIILDLIVRRKLIWQK